ncbi:MAG: PIN domain-containing protein [Schaedlerella sp.]
MQILIDTNVILDWLMHREPFSENAKYIMEEAMFGNVEGYLTAHTFSDLFYILRKDIDVSKRKLLLLLLCEYFHIIVENKETIRMALLNERWNDLEDGLQMQCAIEKNLDYIVTRNKKDFSSSKVKAILPEEWIELYKRQE